jgi:hypothetical protein
MRRVSSWKWSLILSQVPGSRDDRASLACGVCSSTDRGIRLCQVRVPRPQTRGNSPARALSWPRTRWGHPRSVSSSPSRRRRNGSSGTAPATPRRWEGRGGQDEAASLDSRTPGRCCGYAISEEWLSSPRLSCRACPAPPRIPGRSSALPQGAWPPPSGRAGRPDRDRSSSAERSG